MSPLPAPDVQTGIMPRRQSCDRCHEQKVRCFTNEKDCISSDNDFPETGMSQSGRFFSPNPCTRCKRAKATCIYSPQQRSGRPRLPRNTSTLTRKRARGASRRSSSSTYSSRSPNTSPTSSPSVATANTLNAPDTTSWTQYDPNQQQHYGSQVHLLPLHTDMTFLNSPDSCYYPDNGASHGQDQITFCEWLPFKPANTGLSTPESASADNPAANPLIPLRSNASPGTLYTHAKTASPPEAIWSFDVPSKRYPEQLTDINVSIYRAATGLSTLHSLPLSSYLPPINEIFDACAALAELVENYAAERITTPTSADEPHATSLPIYGGAYSSAFDFNTTSTAALSIQSTMDVSVSPMIYVCYRSLMSALEDICSLFLVWLSELNQSASLAFTPPSETVGQVVNMTNVLSHLLLRLEQALKSVEMGGPVAVSSPQSTGYHQMDGVPDMVQTPVPLLSDSTPGSISYSLHGDEFHYSPGQDMEGAMGTSAFALMAQSQERVESQVRVIKKWIRRFGDII